MKSAIHLGLEYDENLIACQNTNFEGIKTLFDIILRLIVENSFEILNLSAIYDYSPWMRSTLCHEQVINWAKAEVRLLRFSLVSETRCIVIQKRNEKWKDQISVFQQDKEYAELSGIGGEPIEFEWNISQDSHRLRFSDKSRKIRKLDK